MVKISVPKEIKKVNDYTWELPKSYKKGMNVPARIFASKELLEGMDEGVFDQVTNVACLPGILKHAYCMPDGHWGYGFPIGGVAAFDPEEGVISPGGIGFDINCGMRLITTPLTEEEVRPKLKQLINLLFDKVPAGVGKRSSIRINDEQFKKLMVDGLKWAVDNGYGIEDDLTSAEEGGKIKFADPKEVSDKAIKRGGRQLGTLGSGNHYLEVQVVRPEEIFDKEKAEKLGLFENQVVVMVHCGSRGFGHQVATDYLKVFAKSLRKYGLRVKDKQLACAPFKSEEGQSYYKAMACAANYAFANRQIITHRIREAFNEVFGTEMDKLKLVYDVTHNIAKLEKFEMDGEEKEVLVHRKGSTRSFGPSRSELHKKFKETGQPVILGGSMETGSHLLVGTDEASNLTFGSTAHGSGRTMSRTKAKNQYHGEKLQKDMENKGIYVKAASMKGLAEEAGGAYKNINEVVEAIHKAKISHKVVALRPIGNVKG